jgi:hypothetical protein
MRIYSVQYRLSIEKRLSIKESQRIVQYLTRAPIQRTAEYRESTEYRRIYLESNPLSMVQYLTVARLSTETRITEYQTTCIESIPGG